MAIPVPNAAFSSSHPVLPIWTAPISATQTAVQAQFGRNEGTLVIIETTTPGALYTVPANKTFTGMVYLQAAGAGSVTVGAATGGTLAAETMTSSVGGSSPVTVPVTVAGGASGNAISLATTGAPSIVTVALVGHVK